ncbi:hypothetical protein PENTCL1PPCAC_1819, partial [Pristionchus entomophagus]
TLVMRIGQGKCDSRITIQDFLRNIKTHSMAGINSSHRSTGAHSFLFGLKKFVSKRPGPVSFGFASSCVFGDKIIECIPHVLDGEERKVSNFFIDIKFL